MHGATQPALRVDCTNWWADVWIIHLGGPSLPHYITYIFIHSIILFLFDDNVFNGA